MKLKILNFLINQYLNLKRIIVLINLDFDPENQEDSVGTVKQVSYLMR